MVCYMMLFFLHKYLMDLLGEKDHWNNQPNTSRYLISILLQFLSFYTFPLCLIDILTWEMVWHTQALC